MNASSRWPLTSTEKKKLIQTLTENLPLLRAKLDISQDEISKIIGISRQTCSAVESEKRIMSWQVYLAFVLFFDVNTETHDLLHHLGCFPEILTAKAAKRKNNKKQGEQTDET